jgi:hypothetical protein
MEENPYRAPKETWQPFATPAPLRRRFFFSVGLLSLLVVLVASHVEMTGDQIFLRLFAFFLAVLALCIAVVVMRNRL